MALVERSPLLKKTEVIGGVKINHTQLPGKSEPLPTSFIVEIATPAGEKIERTIFIGDEVELPPAKGDTKKVSVFAPPSYPYLIGSQKENRIKGNVTGVVSKNIVKW